MDGASRTAPASVAVVGAGYVGTPTALVLASFGHRVWLAERDSARRAALASGRSMALEEGLEELLVEQLAAGRLELTERAADAARLASFCFVCVATPTGPDGRADLSDLFSVVDELRSHLAPGAILVTKSTVPPGTAEEIAARLGRPDVAVVSNPEFLREGSAISDTQRPDRTVVGSADEAAARAVAELFAPTGAPVVVTDTRTAELIKYGANAFLATKLSYINSLADLATRLGADVAALSRGLGLDPRIGSSFLRPGPGWGGPCLPKDAAALLAVAEDAGVSLSLVEAAIAANAAHQDAVVRDIAGLAGPQGRVAVLGVSFKAHTRDRRDSPSLAVARQLVAEGLHLVAYDPSVPAGDPELAALGLSSVASVAEAARGADVIAALTEWPEFADLDWAGLGGLVARRLAYDARGIFDARAARDAGFRVLGLAAR